MAKSSIRLLFWPVAAARRRFCTATAASSLPEETAVAAAAVSRKESKSLYRRLSALGEAPEGSVRMVLDNWRKEGRWVNVSELIKCVKELRRYHRYGHALEVMDWMEEKKGERTFYTNDAIRLHLIAKVRGTEAAEEYFARLPESAKNQATYGSLLNCYCSEKNADKAISVYNEMKDRNIASNTLVHNNLMSLYSKLGQPENGLAQFEEMKLNSIAPDNLTCCILMNCYASLNDIESVERVIKETEVEGKITLQWSAYSTLAAIYSSAGLVVKAEAALKKVEELMDTRRREPFHFLISLYAGIGNLAEVKRIWESFKAINSKPFNLSYLTMLQALNKFDDVNGQKLLYEEWESVCTAYDVRLTNLMLGSYTRKEMIEEAESLWKKASDKGAIPNFRTCDLFLGCYLKKNEIDSALVWLETATSRLKQDEWKLTGDKVDMFLRSFEEAKDVERAEKFCKTLRKLKCLDSNAYEALLRTYLAANKRDPALHQRIKDDKIEMSLEAKKLLDMVCATK